MNSHYIWSVTNKNWRIVVNNASVICIVLFHHLIYHGCIQQFTKQGVPRAYCSIILFLGLLCPVFYVF